MSIEAMKRALEAIEDLRGYRPDIDSAIETLRTAIQQPVTAIACGITGMAKTTCPYCEQSFAFEHEQPATGEPVYQICKKDSQSISSAWIDVEKQAYEDAGIYPEYGRRTLYAHPAPSEPSLIEKAISSGYFGVLPIKATIPMCKAGWGASGGELTFQEIGRIYEEMYKARPLLDIN